MRVEEQGRFLAEREYATDQLRNEATVASKSEADMRAEFTETENRRKVAHETLRARSPSSRSSCGSRRSERAKLQRDIETMRREAESAWATERMENAVMRERINDVAAEVARLTSVLEGPGNPIEAILADSGRPAAAPVSSNGNGNGAAPARRRLARRPHPRAADPRLAPAAAKRGVRRPSRDLGEKARPGSLALALAAAALNPAFWSGA